MIPEWFTRPLVVGDRGSDVVVVQRKLGVKPTGLFDRGLEVVVRGYQFCMGLAQTGQVDEETAAELGQEAGYDLKPDWFTKDIRCGDPGWSVVADRLGSDDVDALKRFQGNNGLRPTGVVDEWTARKLGQ